MFAFKMKITTRQATLGDIDTLAKWNKQLIEDEQSRNPMNLQQLRERMTGFLKGDYRAVILSVDGEQTGYMLYKEGYDDYFPDQPTVYVRQFFIDRSKRSKGIGEAAFNHIAEKHLPKKAELSLDVLDANPRGRLFWEKIGFKPYYTTMKRKDA
jgi:GNAT superfamily N-acetyltransferase